MDIYDVLLAIVDRTPWADVATMENAREAVNAARKHALFGVRAEMIATAETKPETAPVHKPRRLT